jgi:hypothetical protein
MADADIVSGIGEAGDSARPAPGRRRGSRDPKVFVLDRELSEVHLLLDHVSANPNTTVSELSEGRRPNDLPDEWIEKVCEISWPPDGSNEEKADDAALLIKAKDYLNRLSRPASGSTIAFTLLVTQEEAQRPGKWWGKAPAEGEPAPSRSPTRSSLAQTAYPDLITKAAKFRTWMGVISVGLLAVLVVTCLLSWYVAYGNAALAELVTAKEILASAEKRVGDAETAEDQDLGAASVGAGEAKGDVKATPAATATLAAAPAGADGTKRQKFVGYCERGSYLSAGQMQACEARAQAQDDVKRVQRRLNAWVCWFCGNAGEREAGRLADAPSRSAALANIMGSAVLPFLYGLLGAGAAIIRSLSRKIRASLLSPRDLHLSFQQLALGAVVGACIGLFVAAPSGGADGEGLLGPVALSASAISFVAGFGVEAVFQALEALISRIFNIAPAASPARSDAAPSGRTGG